MSTFGQLLRYHRQQCRDPERGSMLTQVLLGELIGLELGDAGYTGAAVAYWEQDKAKINEDDRLVLVSLISVLHKSGGLAIIPEANALLHAGNYRALNQEEMERAFPASSGIAAEEVRGEEITEEYLGNSRDTTPRVESQERRNQLVLLNKVNRFWVQGVLDHSTKEVMQIDLSWRLAPDAVEQPWAGLVDLPAAPIAWERARELDIQRSFEESDRALLILGDPGAGKTTVLLKLAQELINRAMDDSHQPIPVILNLVSWGSTGGSLADWVAHELATKYQIPRHLGRKWLEDDQLLLLLDGLDEVRRPRRQECVEEINQFRQSQGLTGITVCSRASEYGETRVKLKLGSAILLNPLDRDQIEDYFAAGGSRLSVLSSTVKDDRTLRELASSPLMLSVMGVAYSGRADVRTAEASTRSNEISGHDAEIHKGATSRVRRRLFDAYVERMFNRYGGDPAFPQERTTRYLGWLAHQMHKNDKGVFLIEELQPSWLSSLAWRRVYMLFHGLIVGLVAGIILFLFLMLMDINSSILSEDLFRPVVAFFSLPSNVGTFVVMLVGNVVLGLVTSAISAVHMEIYERSDGRKEWNSWFKWQRGIITALAVGLITASFFVPFSKAPLVLAWTMAEVVVFVIVARFIHGQSYGRDIRAVESIGWSWSHAVQGLFVGLLLGGAATVVGSLFTESITSRTAIMFTTGGFMLGGMRGRRVAEKSRPNEGVLLSLRNACLAALLMGPLLGLEGLVFFDWRHGLVSAMMTSIIVFSLFGGSTVTKHLLLRLLLRIKERMPWRYTRFLDHGCQLVFMRKVGGGYIFIHRILQEYFAASSTTPPDQSPGEEIISESWLQDLTPDMGL